jgi:DNA phosphorothioation-associated putative methyltransferase
MADWAYYRQVRSTLLSVKLRVYQECLERLTFGKRLPGALYAAREEGNDFGPELNQLLLQLAVVFEVGPEFNVIKFRTEEMKVSFLAYPEFMDDPHPALRCAVTIDLAAGKARRTEYAHNLNPPILHRKEAFLALNNPHRAAFAALTQAEDAAGLYEHPATIGFKLNWERLLRSKGLVVEGNQLRQVTATAATEGGAGQQDAPLIHRHKTALPRYDLSKPVKTLIEHGLLKKGFSVFDYGCGQGADVDGLRSLGYEVEGWDPVHRPQTAKREADIVNLGYVLNVIEDPAERLEALVDANRYARRLLVVSTLIQETVAMERAATFADGVLTKRGTFQKFYEQHELQQFLEDALETTVVPAGLGVFYAFRDPADQQDFLAARTRRTVNWAEISTRLGFARPGPKKPRWVVAYEENRELLDEFWALALELGRQPAAEEFLRYAELYERVGSTKAAMRLLVERGGGKDLELAGARRRNDLQVYLALANLRKRVPFSQLSSTLRLDIRTFFGDYQAALAKGVELLYAAGDVDEIALACEDLNLGWQDEQALFVHRSLIPDLPSVLRAYVGCAVALFGDVEQADLVKLHKESGKVTFLTYDDFEGKPLPELQLRIKVNLRTRWVEAFDHRTSGQLLYYKERFMHPAHPQRTACERFSAKLRRLNISESLLDSPSKEALAQLRATLGLNESLNPVRSKAAFQTTEAAKEVLKTQPEQTESA